MATERRRELRLAVLLYTVTLVAAEPNGKPASLIDAVKLREKQALASILNKKVNVNAPQSDGATVRRPDRRQPRAAEAVHRQRAL